MLYHINKSSRLYNGEGYSGRACDLACVEHGKIYGEFGKAHRDAVKLMNRNGVGFDVIPLPITDNLIILN